jgi:hypothetical protein
MPSTAQITANQENSKLSTGPRTAEGQRASSLNAVRHGLTSQLIVFPGEDVAPYEKFKADLTRELRPQGTIEHMLADNIANTQWRIERAVKAEANTLALGHFDAVPALIAAIEEPDRRSALVEAIAWETREKGLRNIQRHEARLQRQLVKLLAEFREQQKRRKAFLDEAVEVKQFHDFNNMPFDSRDFGFDFTATEIQTEINRRKRLLQRK